MKGAQACVAIGALLGMFGSGAPASELQSVSPITGRILRLHFVGGKAFHETLGGNGSDGRVEVSPLDLGKAALGLGARFPREVMHWDSWYRPAAVPGIVPMGPYRYVPETAKGVWEPGYAQQRACYPDAKLWPPHELWFENRLTPATNEFTVGNIAEAAAAYGYLCADAAPPSPPKQKPSASNERGKRPAKS